MATRRKSRTAKLAEPKPAQTEYQIPKRRVPIQLTRLRGRVQAVEVFLGDASPIHGGGERIHDLLNASEPFFPASSAKTKRVSLINRNEVMLVRVAASEHPDGDGGEVEHQVKVLLPGNLAVAGRVRYVRPPSSARLVDFLNDSPPFFPVVDGRGVTLVNKRHVEQVLLLGP